MLFSRNSANSFFVSTSILAATGEFSLFTNVSDGSNGVDVVFGVEFFVTAPTRNGTERLFLNDGFTT